MRLLIEQFTKLNPDLCKLDFYPDLLKHACSESNLSVVKEITEIIQEKHPEYDFTDDFFKAASSKSIDICQYFFDKQVHIEFENNSYIGFLGSIDVELFEKI